MMSDWLDSHEGLKQLADVSSVGITVGALAGWLPTISAALAVVWMGIRVYETKTVQQWFGRDGKES